MSRCVSLVLVLVVSLCSCARAFAQCETASVVGTVKDGAGGPVSGAVITLTSIDTGISQSRTTDEAGSFEFATATACAVRPSGRSIWASR